MRKTITRAFSAILCFVMLATCALSASAAGDFSDVKSSDWYYDYVTYMSDKGIISGYTDDTFRPNRYVTRSEFIKMMVETFGLTAEASISYNDVDEDIWYYDYYRKAAAQGFLGEVFTGRTMRPTEDLTREEAAALLMAYLAYPEDEKASSSEFADYSDISSAYRDYVLQAVEAGIIVGFDEGDEFTFRPDSTLTRAQAAKILAVAAGTIADAGVSNSLEFDESDNLVVTKACTIRNLDIPGNVIISEGVTSGTVNFVNCEIEGTVSNRSKATVAFSGGSVEILDLDVASASVELKQSAEIAELNAYFSGASVEFFTNALVEEFNVVSGSTGVSVSGSGEIETLTIEANSFTSTITPEDCQIDSGVSATVGGVAYKDGVKGNIEVLWADDSEFIVFETYKSGSVRYYYTASSSAPSKTNFTTNYNNAANKASLTATAGKKYTEAIDGVSTSLDDFPYIVAALVDGSTVTSTPIVINREGSKYGFTVMPTLTISTTNDVVKCTPAVAGTLYYYYTNDSTVPATFAAAQNAYKATASTVKGTIDCSASSVSKTTKAVTAVEEYAYCVFYYLGDNEMQYQPILLERPYMTNGLSNEPYILISEKADGKDTLVIKAPTSGTVKVLYTNSTLNYTISSFTTAYNSANVTPAAGEVKLAYSGSVSANKEVSISLAKSTDIDKEGYKYAIVQYGSNLPFRVARITDVDGFESDTLPTVLKTTDKDIIVFTPISDAAYGNSVKYMYISTNKSFTPESFETTYKTIADNVKKEISVSSGIMVEDKSEKQSSNISEQYVAFMYIGSNGAHQPVTVARGAVGNGFVGTPTASYDVDKANATLTFNAKVPFDLQYFVVEKNTYSTDSLAHMFDTGRDNDNKDIAINTIYKKDVDQGENKISLTTIAKADKYIALRAKDTNIKYTPIIISISTVDDGIKGGDVPSISFFSSDGNIHITINASTDALGDTFEYYYTKIKPETTANYNTIFKGSDPSGSYKITSNDSSLTFEAGRWLDMADYVYLAYRVVDNSGNSMTPGYVTLPIDYRANAHIIHDSNEQGKILVAPVDTAKYTVYWFYSPTKLNLTNDNYASTYSNYSYRYNRNYKNIEAEVANDQDNPEVIITDFTQPADGKTVYKYIYVCLKDANNKYYQPVELVVPGTES
ncbi:MAG: S-layer homology domain-containing protein [Clostridia bacterium]|nr:S-layer homology domain-containing protein [Clostridia bacterium]